MTLPAPTYDLVLLLDTQAEESTREKILADARASIQARGELVRDDDWGERPLSYPIDRRKSAEYHLFQFHVSDKELLGGLDRTLRITDGVVRFRLIKLRPGVPDPPDMRSSAVPPTTAPPRRAEGEPSAEVPPGEAAAPPPAAEPPAAPAPASEAPPQADTAAAAEARERPACRDPRGRGDAPGRDRAGARRGHTGAGRTGAGRSGRHAAGRVAAGRVNIRRGRRGPPGAVA